VLFSRPDGERVRDLPLLRRFIPFIMRTRNESVVYLDQQIDVEATLAWLDRVNEGRDGDRKLSFYTVVLAALVHTLTERPRLNRFVSGGRIWQRRGISISFAVKKAMADKATMTTVKVEFQPGDDIEAVADRVRAAIGVGRGRDKTGSEKEMVFFGAMIKPDPMYASVFVANLGSVGLSAPFHHLYEYGNIPIFLTIGKIHKAPVVREDDTLGVARVVDCKYSFDERIADGFYCARSLEQFAARVGNAEALSS